MMHELYIRLYPSKRAMRFYHDTFQIEMSRIRIDLSQVIKQDFHPRIWLHLNENLSQAKDIIADLRKKYPELEHLELRLSLEEFTIPPDESVNIFTQDDIVKVSSVKKNQAVETRTNPQVNGSKDEKKPLVSYQSTNTSTHSSIILSDLNISTTGLSTEAEDQDGCPPNYEPLKWSEQFSNFLKNNGQEQGLITRDSQSLTSSEILPPKNSSDQVFPVATKVMSSVASLETEDIKLNRSSSVNDSAKVFAGSFQTLSISSITDYTLDSDRVMVRKKRSDYLPWYDSSISPSSVKEAKRTQCEAIKKRHEELVSAWTVGNKYKKQYYETGHEDMMWLFSNSQVLGEVHDFMQVNLVYMDFVLLCILFFLQKLSPRRISKATMRGLREGHLVIAIYPVDNQMYRAKIEKVILVSSGSSSSGTDNIPTFRVRYIDYGNICDVSGSQLYSWDEVLEIIPAQAVSCKLDTIKIFTKPLKVGSIEAIEFTEVLKQSNPVSIKVRKVLRPRDGVFNSDMVQKTPELVVDLFDSQGVNIVEKIRSCANLGRLVRDHSLMKSSCGGSSVAVQSRIASSSSKRYFPPKPEHLSSEERVDFDLEEAGVTEAGFSKSLERVEGWLSGLTGEMIPIIYPQPQVIIT